MNDIHTSDPPKPGGKRLLLDPGVYDLTKRVEVTGSRIGDTFTFTPLNIPGGIRIVGFWHGTTTQIRPVTDPTGPDAFTEALDLIANLIDPEDCWFDHHGGCQAHSYLDLEQGETCPVQHAKEFLARHKTGEVTT